MDCIILIDPFCSSVALTFSALKKTPYFIITIRTPWMLDEMIPGLVAKKSDLVLDVTENLEETLKKIQFEIERRNLNVFAIQNLQDNSLYFADLLKNKLLHMSLDLQNSKVRQNKHSINKKLARLRVPSIPGIEVSDPDEANARMQEVRDIGFPVIAKPSQDSCGKTAVKLIVNEMDISKYFQEFYNKPNQWFTNKRNCLFMLQKHFSPQIFSEYGVDFISRRGKHYCTGIMARTKRIIIVDGESHAFTRKFEPYLPEEITNSEKLISYLSKCLDALEVCDGITHNDVLWDNNNTAYLIESNPRNGGGGLEYLYKNAFGTIHFQEYLKLSACNKAPSLSRIAHAALVFIYNQTKNKFTNLQLEKLASFQKIYSIRNYNMLRPDFFKAFEYSAKLILRSTSKCRLEDDIDTIIKREANGSLFADTPTS